MKNYVGFVNDHSGSMSKHRRAAIDDYNATTKAFCDAANKQMLDTVVSVVGVGIGHAKFGRYVGSGEGYGVSRQVVISNPHVLKPIDTWSTLGGTPLWDGIGDMIELFKSLPDYDNPDVSFLVMVTTDGQEEHSGKWSETELRKEIQALQATGRWTFVFRVPRNGVNISATLGVPIDNVQVWDTTSSEGLKKSTAATEQAVNNFYAGRSAGSKSSTVFYAQAASVDVSALKDITKDVSLYVVPHEDMGIEIRDFILKKRMQYLKGSAFYQLTKTEPRVQHTKLIAVRDRTTGKIYAGKEARSMIGLPDDRNARLHPGDHGNYDIFIQSESVNRKLVGGTGVLYWEAIGKQFTEADLAYLKKPAKTEAPAVVQLPAVAATNKPTPSPIPKAVVPSVDGRPARFFQTRDQARDYARAYGKKPSDSFGRKVTGNEGKRWFVFL